MKRCLDEAKLQAYFDGELSLEQLESVTSHLASCANCAALARELEEESALVMNALAAELEASVPTERLRQRIDEAMLGNRLAAAQSSTKPGFLSGLLNFGTQRTLGYASLAVLVAFAAIMVAVKMKTTTPAPAPSDRQIAVNVTPSTPSNADVNKSAPEVTNAPVISHPIKVNTPERQPANPGFRRVNYTAPVAAAPKPAPVKLIPGERSYLQTIARLDSTIQSNKKSMRPSLQVEYERNLAVVDGAIAAARSAAKSNPSDPDAADFMFAAYQSKVDLLNTIADARVGGGRGH